MIIIVTNRTRVFLVFSYYFASEVLDNTIVKLCLLNQLYQDIFAEYGLKNSF